LIKRAIISDIHANLEALQAVIADITTQSVDQIYCLGDIIGYGPDPCKCIDLCLDFNLCLLGNHDNGALFDPEGFSATAEEAILWTREQLKNGDVESAKRRMMFIARCPRTYRDGDVMFVHGSPRSPLNEYVFPEDAFNQQKMGKIFSFVENVCFQGHTHVPGVFTESGRFFAPHQLEDGYTFNGEKVLINVGSVGQPRDNDPRSCYVIQSGRHIQYRRVEYPCRITYEKIAAIDGLDNFLGERLLEGR
jgi:predicted phosphodiesterase